MLTVVWICFACVFFGSAMGSDTPSPTPPKKPLWNDTWTDILKRDLLMTYDKYARPSQPNEKTNVNTSLSVHHIAVDENKFIFSVFGWLKMQWNDPKLLWDPADYGNLSVLHVGDHEIWQPDILLYNSAAGNGLEHFGSTHCLVYNNGSVLWVPPTLFTSNCEMDMHLWPYDSHRCNLKIGSWTYDALQIDLVEGHIELDVYTANYEWTITHVDSQRNIRKYECCDQPYVDIDHNIYFTRRSPMFRAVVLVPALVVILMTLSNFWLPAQSGEKIMLNGVNVIVVVGFLIFFAQRIPVMSSSTPLVVTFYTSSLYMLGASMVISVIVIHFSKNKQSRPVPWFVKSQLDGCLGSFLGLKRLSFEPIQTPSRSEELRDHNPTAFDEHNSANDNDHIINGRSSSSLKHGPTQQYWILLATAIDRIAFVIYFVVFFILTIIYAI